MAPGGVFAIFLRDPNTGTDPYWSFVQSVVIDPDNITDPDEDGSGKEADRNTDVLSDVKV